MKKTIMSVMAGVVLGAGGDKLGSSLLSAAEAKASAPLAHAVDLRRDLDGARARVLAWGSVARDGGFADVGQARGCSATQQQIAECMNAIGKTCAW